VKQGYATWEKNPEEQQRTVGRQTKQPQTASSGDLSPGMKSNVVSGTSEKDHKNGMVAGDSSKIKSDERALQEDSPVLGGDVWPAANVWDKYDSENGLEMG